MPGGSAIQYCGGRQVRFARQLGYHVCVVGSLTHESCSSRSARLILAVSPFSDSEDVVLSIIFLSRTICWRHEHLNARFDMTYFKRRACTVSCCPSLVEWRGMRLEYTLCFTVSDSVLWRPREAVVTYYALRPKYA